MCEMALMRRVLPTARAFTTWASTFMPSLVHDTDPTGAAILTMPIILDRTDARLVHLDGLLLSKAWTMRACAADLERGGASASVTSAMRLAADAHYEAAAWDTDAYVGSHWLHSFAALALDGE